MRRQLCRAVHRRVLRNHRALPADAAALHAAMTPPPAI